MSNNNHNSDCGFAAEIPAYLYGEIGEREKSGFENHLETCSSCADALADSSFALFSVREWRDAEFAQMKTPIINIPYEQSERNEQKTKQRDVVSIASDSRLARLRQYFSLSPAWAAGGAMAVLAIGFGLIFAAVNMFQPVEFAEVDTNSANITVSPTTPAAVPKSEKFSEQLPEPPVKKIEMQQSETARRNNQTNSPDAPESNVLKISSKASTNKIVRRNTENALSNNRLAAETADKTRNRIKPASSGNAKVPALTNFEEEEDKSLRLADLFEDTGAR